MTPVTLLGSELHTMTSKHNGRTYDITVSLPLGYDAPAGSDWPFHNTPDRWPVVYVLDGNWYAAMVTGMIRPMAWCGGTTDAIVVGIGYPEGDDSQEAFRVSFTRRDHDLTPVHDAAIEKSMTANHKRPVPNGDAGGFHKFIGNELIPFIEKSYRADPARRILAGHSYGGLFALFGLFRTPETFQSYIIGSPTLSYGSGIMFEREEAFAKENKPLPATIYFFMSELEEDPNDSSYVNMLRLLAILEGRNYQGFSLVKRIYKEFNHCEVAAPGVHWGLTQALKT